jgi:hypothetical protein
MSATSLVQIIKYFEDSPIARRKWDSLDDRRKAFMDDIIALGGQFVKGGPDDGILLKNPERGFDRFFSFPVEDVETVRELLEDASCVLIVHEEGA